MSRIATLIADLLSIEAVLIIIRVLLSWFPSIDHWNPLVRALRAVTDPVLAPFRRLLPAIGGIDLSPILAIIVVQQAASIFADYAAGFVPSVPVELALILQRLIHAVLVIMVILALLRALLSIVHVDPFHPATRMIRDLSRPVVEPFRAMVPRSRSVDLAAVAAIVTYVVVYKLVDLLFEHVIYPALVTAG